MSWKSFSKQTLEQEYSPSSCVNNLDILLAAYVSESQKSERLAQVKKDLLYGEMPDELLDYFPATSNKSALVVFIHGGYWQELSKNESTFAGAGFVQAGIAYAAINYTLAPKANIRKMIDQCRLSIQWLYENAEELGFDKNQIYLSGSSAGAHLASVVLLTEWKEYGLPHDAIKGGTLLSGIYDLRPICNTYINDALQLNEHEARELSPLFMSKKRMPPITICWGENETNEFKRQSLEFSQACLSEGNEVNSFEVEGVNHFDIVHTLAKPDTKLGTQVITQINGGHS